MAKTTKVSSADSRPPRSGILMVLSPAKTLDLSEELPLENLPLTQPDCSPAQTSEVATALKKLSTADLTQKLKVSAKLGQTASEYWSNFRVNVTEDDADAVVAFQKPCIYAYSGAAYQGLNVADCSRETVLYLQQNLRILSAVYGLLRPLDVIQPYRLEIGTTNVLPSTKLATYWSEAVTKRLAQDLEAHIDESRPILLNLASDEYAAAVDPDALPRHSRYIKAVFQDEGRVIAVHAKRARGLMVRYLAENRVNDLEGIRNFDSEGYKLVASKSDDTTLVFNRPKEAAAAAKKRPAATKRPTSTRKKTKA